VPDASVFSAGAAFEPDVIAGRMRELAFLNAGAALKLRVTKHGAQLLPPPGGSSSSDGAAAAAAAAEAGQQQQEQQQRDKPGAHRSSSKRSSTAAPPPPQPQQQQQQQLAWQVFHAQDGLREYVEW
jgi:hypothetical protein